jgi:hypothetical protein
MTDPDGRKVLEKKPLAFSMIVFQFKKDPRLFRKEWDKVMLKLIF